MQTVEKSSKYIEGIFVKELKNRFLCEVLINGESTVCYVPSSCHLSNFLDLKGKTVLLIPTQNPKSRTPYALFAVPFKRSYATIVVTLLNLNTATTTFNANVASVQWTVDTIT